MSHLILPKNVDSKFRFITVASQRAKQLQNVAQRLAPRELLEVRARRHERLRLHLADDLDALDRVDSQVALDVEVEPEHLERVPGTSGHLVEQHGFDRHTARHDLDSRRGEPVVGPATRAA